MHCAFDLSTARKSFDQMFGWATRVLRQQHIGFLQRTEVARYARRLLCLCTRRLTISGARCKRVVRHDVTFGGRVINIMYMPRVDCIPTYLCDFGGVACLFEAVAAAAFVWGSRRAAACTGQDAVYAAKSALSSYKQLWRVNLHNFTSSDFLQRVCDGWKRYSRDRNFLELTTEQNGCHLLFIR